MPPVDVTSPVTGAVDEVPVVTASVASIEQQVASFTASVARIEQQVAAPCIAAQKQVQKQAASFARIEQQVASFVAKMAPRWQPCRSHRRSSGRRTSARRTRRSGAARAPCRSADEPAEPPSGRDAGLALSLAVVGGLDTLPACWPVIA